MKRLFCFIILGVIMIFPQDMESLLAGDGDTFASNDVVAASNLAPAGEPDTKRGVSLSGRLYSTLTYDMDREWLQGKGGYNRNKFFTTSGFLRSNFKVSLTDNPHKNDD